MTALRPVLLALPTLWMHQMSCWCRPTAWALVRARPLVTMVVAHPRRRRVGARAFGGGGEGAEQASRQERNKMCVRNVRDVCGCEWWLGETSDWKQASALACKGAITLFRDSRGAGLELSLAFKLFLHPTLQLHHTLTLLNQRLLQQGGGGTGTMFAATAVVVFERKKGGKGHGGIQARFTHLQFVMLLGGHNVVEFDTECLPAAQERSINHQNKNTATEARRGRGKVNHTQWRTHARR